MKLSFINLARFVALYIGVTAHGWAAEVNDKHLMRGNSLLEAYFSNILQDLKRVARYRKPLKIRIYNSLIPNAYALEDGTILITSGLVAITDHPDEVASVIAHELSHIVKRHHKKERSYLQSRASLLVEDETLNDEDRALMFLTSKSRYSQKQELEADKYALRLLKKIGVSRQSYGQLLGRLRRYDIEATELGMLSGFNGDLSSHPSYEDRLSLLGVEKKRIGQKYNPEEYRKLRSEFPIYRVGTPVVRRDNRIYFKDIPLFIDLPENVKHIDGVVDSFEVDTRKGKFYLLIKRWSASDDKEKVLPSVLTEHFFSYSKRSSRKLGNREFFTLQSEIVDRDCIEVSFQSSESLAVLVWTDIKTNCMPVKNTTLKKISLHTGETSDAFLLGFPPSAMSELARFANGVRTYSYSDTLIDLLNMEN